MLNQTSKTTKIKFKFFSTLLNRGHAVEKYLKITWTTKTNNNWVLSYDKLVWQIFWCQLFLGLNSISLCNIPCNITCYLHTISCIFQKPQRALSTVGRYSHSCMCDMNEKAFAQKSFLRTDMCAWYKTFTRFAFAFQPKGMLEYWNFKIFYHHRKIWHTYHFFG